jgi:hypothetical protein
MTKLFLRVAACAALVASSALAGCAAPDPSQVMISKGKPENKNDKDADGAKLNEPKPYISISDSEEFRRRQGGAKK